MGSQNFPCSCGHYFVGSKFFLVNKNLTTVREDVSLWTRITHENHEHWSPRNNDDSIVFLNVFKILMYICRFILWKTIQEHVISICFSLKKY